MTDLPQPCPRAKLLINTWQCPCHGMWKEERKVQKPSQAKAAPKRPQELTPEQVEEIRRLYSEGASKRELVAQFRCGRPRITTIVGKSETVRHPLTEIQVEEIQALYSQGVSIKMLRQKFHTSHDRVKGAIEGLPDPSSLSLEEIDKIRQAHVGGESIRSIAMRLERDRRAIYRALGRGDMQRSSRPPCSSEFILNDTTYHCHLKKHEDTLHRTEWLDGEDTGFRVEWK